MADGAPKWLGTASGVSLGAVVLFVASNGERLAASLTALWNWVALVAEKMPMGLLAFLAGNVLGCLVMAGLRHWIPEPEEKDWMHARILVIELASSAAAFAVVWSQERSVMNLAMAAICGLLVPMTYRAFAAVGLYVRKRFRAAA